MKHYSKAAALGALLIATFLPISAAHAEGAQCAEGTHANGNTDPNAPYCSPDVPNVGSEDVNNGGGDNGAVLPAEAEKPTSGGSTDVAPGSGESTPVGAPASAENAPTAATAPSGTLPFTGGDVVGMAIIGAGALGIGTVLVKRSKKSGSAA
jgi:hypothetical protein